jgi:hypothetical protein
MAGEIEITIHQADLSDARSEFGSAESDLKLFDDKGEIQVDVYVNGESVTPEKKNSSIAVKRPSSAPGRRSTVVVSAHDGKTLCALQYEGDQKVIAKDPADNGSALRDIAAAVKRIADVMNPPTPPSGATPPAAPIPSAAATSSRASSSAGASSPPKRDR